MTYAAEPPVAAYLRDLARALGDSPPRERAAVIGSVCDHIDDAAAELGHAPTSEDLQAIVADLGPAADVAATWSQREQAPPEVAPAPARPRRSVTVAPAPARPRRSVTDRPVGVVLVVLVGVALGLALTPLSAALGWGSPATMLFVTIVSYLRWHKDEDGHRAGWRTLFVVTLPALVVTAFVMVAAAMATVADAGSS